MSHLPSRGGVGQDGMGYCVDRSGVWCGVAWCGVVVAWRGVARWCVVWSSVRSCSVRVAWFGVVRCLWLVWRSIVRRDVACPSMTQWNAVDWDAVPCDGTDRLLSRCLRQESHDQLPF